MKQHKQETVFNADPGCCETLVRVPFRRVFETKRNEIRNEMGFVFVSMNMIEMK